MYLSYYVPSESTIQKAINLYYFNVIHQACIDLDQPLYICEIVLFRYLNGTPDGVSTLRKTSIDCCEFVEKLTPIRN
jgi:hypothetical protein